MATLYSLELGGSNSNARTYPKPGVGLGGRTQHAQRGTYTITAALALNDTIQLFDLPIGARVVGGFIKSDDLDTGGTGLRIDVGDAGSSVRYMTGGAGTPGPVAAVLQTINFAGMDFVVTSGNTRVLATVSVAPTTGATTGTFTVVLYYFINEPA